MYDFSENLLRVEVLQEYTKINTDQFMKEHPIKSKYSMYYITFFGHEMINVFMVFIRW